MEYSAPIRLYRWIVFLAAVFYFIWSLTSATWDPGGPFRYLTVWGLCLALYSALRVLLVSYEISDKRCDPLISAAVVINAMVVFLYWRLYFADPLSVTSDGTLGNPWREYYMHGVGAVLLSIDALFINRVFRKLGSAAITLIGIVLAYVAWAELFVQRFNDEPIGKVTSGLPYPFMNNLELADRAIFYGSNVIVAMVFLFGFAAIAWVVRRVS